MSAGRYNGAPELIQRVLRSARVAGDVILRCVGDKGEINEVCVAEQVAAAEVLAWRLAAAGIAQGELVAIRGAAASLPTSTAILACALGGFVAAPLVSLLGDGDVDAILDSAGARALLSEHAIRGRDLSAHLTHVRDQRPDLICAGIGELDRSGFRLPEAIEGTETDWSTISERSIAFVQFSSGTTGAPKGVAHSYATLMAEVWDFADQLDVTSGGRLLQPFPLGHIGGLAGLFIALAFGRETTMLSSWSASLAADIIDTYSITATGSTPYFAQTLFDERARRGSGLESLKTMESGGGYVGRELVLRADEFGIALSRGYGSSEHPTATTHHSWDSLEVRSESDGLPTNGTRIRIIGADGVDLSPGADGEVLLAGPEQMVGYLSGDRSAFLDDDWFRTGDIGRLTPEGRLVITGRLKELIIRGGENISVGEVEEVLSAHPSIVEAAVAAVPDPKFGERAHAFVVLAPDASGVDLNEVRRWFESRRIAKFKTPEFVTIVDELPRNALGKVQKSILVEQSGQASSVVS